MKLLGFKINGYLVILAILLLLLLSGALGCGCSKNSRSLNKLASSLSIDESIRKSSLEMAKNDFIRQHYIHNQKNVKNCPCTKKQLQMLHTRGNNSQPINAL